MRAYSEILLALYDHLICSMPSLPFSFEGGVLCLSWVVTRDFSAVEKQLDVLSVFLTTGATISGLATLMPIDISSALSASTLHKHQEMRQECGKR